MGGERWSVVELEKLVPVALNGVRRLDLISSYEKLMLYKNALSLENH
jgi:hypothetical protein